ncbi:MAG: ABC transporter permease [Candidatus Handelsmanbacteria bacterium]|nr:ABC transporter permease [Candidatus Handelsmanbacteria bacterium]
MKWKNLLRVALKAIARNKMRSLLTMLGIIIGVGSVITMVAVGEGAQAQIEKQINSLGTNLLVVFPGASRQGGVSMGGGSGTRLTLEDVDKLGKEAELVSGVSPVVRAGVQAVGGIGNWNTSVQGVSPDFLEIRQWPLVSGDFFTAGEVRSQAKVCVIGQTIVTNLFPDQDPVGQELRLRNVPFKIIGVLSEKGQGAGGMDQDDAILIPYTTAMYRLSGWRFIQQILCSAVSAEQLAAAQEEIRVLLRENHKLQEGDEDDFTIRNQTDLASTAQEATRTMTMLLAAIASVSLVVGGIGIMNIMLVSVTERTREIGIRMAIGARPHDILVQFLVEAVALSLSGGLIGIAIGFLARYLMGALSGMEAVISAPTVFLAFGFSGAVGIFFGFYPARKAAALNPIDALRYE